MPIRIDWCSRSAAKFSCENYHYSKTMPVGKLVTVGVWEDSEFIGCVIYGRGANNNLLKTYKLKPSQGCELTRVALKKHKIEVTKIISESIKLLKKICPELRLIISYADADQNHIGIIYKAGNWIYVGKQLDNKFDGSYIINGKRIHGRTLFEKTKKMGGLKGLSKFEFVKKYIDKNAIRYKTKGKYKYLMPLDKAMRKSIECLRKPYPAALV